MRQRGIWAASPPPDEAFASTMPFFVDRMDFLQWLQFVFIERIRTMIETDLDLPKECAIAPMAELHFAEAGIVAEGVVSLLAQVDLAITRP